MSTNNNDFTDTYHIGYNEDRRNVISELLFNCFCYPVRYPNQVPITEDLGIYSCKFSKYGNSSYLRAVSSKEGIVFNYSDVDDQNWFIPRGKKTDIYDISWSDCDSKLVSAGKDGLSRLLSVGDTGSPTEVRTFQYNSPVNSVMYCPGSPDIFAGGAEDGYMSLWDSRVNNDGNILRFKSRHLTYNSHQVIQKKSGIFNVIFKDTNTVLSSSLKDREIKVWDLRYIRQNTNRYPLPFKKFYKNKFMDRSDLGFNHMIMNAQSTEIYASSEDSRIYRFSLNSEDPVPMCRYSGFKHGSIHSKISLSPDGRLLLSGCELNSVVIWLTEYPYSEIIPDFELSSSQRSREYEFCATDWHEYNSETKLLLCCNSELNPIITIVCTEN